MGVRWYELRSPGATPTVYQQGTYAPADSKYRWMGSIAMDKQGNIALGFSISGSNINPGIHYTGRLATDQLGTMTQGEGILIDGSGSQTVRADGTPLIRWGDYSSISVDPTDDCNFWYTSEYVKTNGVFNWSTHIGSFSLGTCLPLTISPGAPTVPPKGSLTFTASGGSGGGYTWSLTTNASGGSINTTTGAYSAGSTGLVTDVVQVTDSLANAATVSVTVMMGMSISPGTTSVPPKGSLSFTAIGGSGTGYAWSLATNASGASINPATGVYTAGGTGAVTDVVQVTDSVGNTATRSLTVTAGISISLPADGVPPRGSVTLTAGGGSGAGFNWSLATNVSGGSINSATGAYTAGATGGVTDTVRVTDSLGNLALKNVIVTAGISISPATTSVSRNGSVAFTASGGSGIGYTWSLRNNASGASINAESGVYTAGGIEAVTDLVQVIDSLGNARTTEVSVIAVRLAQGGGGGCATGDAREMSLVALMFVFVQSRHRRRHGELV